MKYCKSPEKKVSKAFRLYGEFLGNWPLPFLICPFVLNLLLAYGVLKMDENRDIRSLYIPTNSPSLDELHRIQQFQQGSTLHYELNIYFESRRNASLLGNATMLKIISVVNYVERDLTFTYNQSDYNFTRLKSQLVSSDSTVYGSAAFRVFSKIYKQPDRRNDSHTKLTFPVGHVYGKRIFMPLILANVETERLTSIITSAKVVRIGYMLNWNRTESSPTCQLCSEFSQQLNSYRDEVNGNNSDFSMATYSSDAVSNAVHENTIAALPAFGLSFLFLTLFAVIVSFKSDSHISKPWESLAGVLSALMAVISTYGLMFLLGYQMNSALVTMPFLIIAIGVDDMYLIIECWHEASPKLPVNERLGETLADAGTSIIFAALTDAISFGLGVVCTNTTAVGMFCMFTAVAVCFDFLYQLTFYLSLFVYGARREAKGMNCCCTAKVVTDRDSNSSRSNLVVKLGTLSKVAEWMGSVRRHIVKTFSFISLGPVTKSLTIGSLMVYLIFAVIGCCTVKSNLGPAKFVLANSPLRPVFDIIEKYLLKEGNLATVLISTPFNLSDSVKIEEIMRAVGDLESVKFAAGADSTVFWLKEFLSYRRQIATPNPSEIFDDWLQLPTFVPWKSQLISETQWNGEILIKQTILYTGFTNLVTWRDRSSLVQSWRNISGAYSNLNLTVYQLDNLFSDQVASQPDSIMQDIGLGLMVLTGISYLFFPDLHATFWIEFFMQSIMVGVIGYLSLWGADLDPLTTISVTVALGFSVDFTCHVSCKFFTVDCANPHDRAKLTLNAMGWTIVKCAVSTILGVGGLVFVHSYMMQCFFMTVFCVVTIGVYHSVVILPIVLSCVL